MCDAVGPCQRELAIDYVGKPQRHQFSFVPQDVGPHVIDLRCGCDMVVGGPFTCNVYDASKVRVLDVTECAEVGDEFQFTGMQTCKHVYKIFLSGCKNVKLKIAIQ